MARIPEEDIERLKQEVSVQRLVEAQGIVLKRHGADLLGLCPFHDDHEPSLAINPKKNLWHLFPGRASRGIRDSTMTARIVFVAPTKLLRPGTRLPIALQRRPATGSSNMPMISVEIVRLSARS